MMPSQDLPALLCLHSLNLAIQSLDTLNDQIVEFIFHPNKSCQIDLTPVCDNHNGDTVNSPDINGTTVNNGSASKQQREALKSSMALMRRLLVDAQAKFRKMVEDNKQLASRIDGDIQNAQDEVSVLRAELADTNKRITEISSNGTQTTAVNGETSATKTDHNGADANNKLIISNDPYPTNIASPDSSLSSYSSVDQCSPPPGMVNGKTADVTNVVNATKCLSCSDKVEKDRDTNQLKERISTLEEENEKLGNQNRSLKQDVEELQQFKVKMQIDENEQKPKLKKLESELNHAHDALCAFKQDRKRLKSEKFDLLNQMKQLYGTLEDKEKELREFIRSYEHCMKESDKSLKQLVKERDECEHEKWNILKHARDEAERSVALCAQLGLKEAQMKQLEEENRQLKEKCRLSLNDDRLKNSRMCLYNSIEAGTTKGDSAVDRDNSATPTPSIISSPQPTITVDSDCSPPLHNGGTSKDTLSPLLHPGSPQGLSRSAEEIFTQSLPLGDRHKKHRRKDRTSRSTWNTISRVFSRGRHKKNFDPTLSDYDKRSSWSPQNSLCASPLSEDGYTEKIRLLEEAQTVPMDRWKAATVLAWLEVSLGMPQYASLCLENVKSGKVLLELTDSEIESGLGIINPMHRRKLRYAIEEHRNPTDSPYAKISHVTHVWIVADWLPSLGLSCYCDTFSQQLVDGRMLEKISKKDLDKYLNVNRKFHQFSILHGIELLRVVQYDKQVLTQRRSNCEHMDIDPLVWSNQRFIKWARSIDLGEYAENLRDSGVHGALVVLEPSFNAEAMATALGIPTSKNIIRRHLTTELENLIQPARMSIEAESVISLKRNKFPTGSLGRNFIRSHSKTSIDQKGDKRRTSLRGSLTKALGVKVKQELQSSPSLHSAKDTSCSSITTSFTSSSTSEQQSHRRVRSQSDIDTVTVTPV